MSKDEMEIVVGICLAAHEECFYCTRDLCDRLVKCFPEYAEIIAKAYNSYFGSQWVPGKPNNNW